MSYFTCTMDYIYIYFFFFGLKKNKLEAIHSSPKLFKRTSKDLQDQSGRAQQYSVVDRSDCYSNLDIQRSEYDLYVKIPKFTCPFTSVCLLPLR